MELTVVIPTLNEKDNIQLLLSKLEAVLNGFNWEVIFVDDDSSDGTPELIRKISLKNPRVRCLQRINRRGLSSACIEGMMACASPYIAVMDADLQHDETILKKMFQTLKEKNLDIVVGSRYTKDGNAKNWSGSRLKISRWATRLSHLILRCDLKDPMSGFFILKRDFLNKIVRQLSGKGFKILLDIFASSKDPVKFEEIPIHFRRRNAGKSKLNILVVSEYILLIADKLIGYLIPVKFVLYVLVGLFGAMLHLATLFLCIKILQLPFILGQSYATFVAMTANFSFNNLFTYNDKRLHGRAFFYGLLSFYLACSVGLLINLATANFLIKSGVQWWQAGLLGAIVGSVWNYGITATFTWKKI